MEEEEENKWNSPDCFPKRLDYQLGPFLGVHGYTGAHVWGTV